MSDRPPIPCVIYAARSQAEETGKDSTGDQVALIRERLQGDRERRIVGEPRTDHASGYRGNRGPGLERAIADAEAAVRAHGTAELWVWITSRLGRGTGRLGEARAVGALLYELRAKGITVRSVEDDEFATNEMLWGFASRMASKYAEDLSAHTKRGISFRVESGKPWGEPGYGYRRGEDGHWVPDPEEKRIANRLLAEYVERTPSFSGVAAIANRDGIRTRRGKRWSPATVRKLLTSRHLIGEFSHQGEWRKGKHPAIVDLDVWEAAQRIAEAGKKFAPGGRTGRPVSGGHIFIRGSLRCGVCGEAMLPRSASDAADFYVCRTRAYDTAACPMPRIKRAQVDAAALRLFQSTALDLDATREHLAAQLTAQAEATRAQMQRAERDVSSKRAALDRFDRDYEAGALSAANYERQVARVAEETAGAEAEVARLAAQAERTLRAVGDLDAEHETLRRLARLREQISGRVTDAQEDVGALRAAILDVFAVVIVGPEGTFWPGYPEDGTDYVAPVEAVRNPVLAPSWSEAEDGGLLSATAPEIWAESPPPLVLAPVPRPEVVESYAAVSRVRIPLSSGKTSEQGTGVPEYPAAAGTSVLAELALDDVQGDRLAVGVDDVLELVGAGDGRLELDGGGQDDAVEPLAAWVLGADLELAADVADDDAARVGDDVAHLVGRAADELLGGGGQPHGAEHLQAGRQLRHPEGVDPRADHRAEVVVHLDVPAGDHPVDVHGPTAYDAAG